MKTRLLLLVGCVSALLPFANAQLYTGTALQNSGGNIARVVPFAPVTVCAASDSAVPCTVKANIFTDESLATQCTAVGGNGAPLSGTGCNNPGLADANGNFVFFASPGVYRICVFATNVQCIKVSTGGGSSGSGISCSGAPSVVIQSTIGVLAICDPQMVPDGNGSLSLVNLTASGNVTATGTVSGSRLSTTGTGGILDLQFQTPPATIPTGHAYVYGNSNTGLLDCLKNGSVECFSGIQAVATGTVSLPTSAIASGACSSVVTLTATGATTSSHIIATPASDPTGVTGYGPSASGSLYVQAYVTANTGNFKVCNNTSSTITPGALTLNAVVF